MMGGRSTPLKQSSHTCNSGFSLTELLVGMTLTLVVFGAALVLSVGSKRIYDADKRRTDTNQNLRASKELLVSDLRQIGERLATDFPAFEIINGAGGAPDEIVIRRNLLDTVLRVCREVKNQKRRIYVGEKTLPPPPGCTLLPDDDANGFPDNVDDWRDLRLAIGGSNVRGYIYDPVSGNGEFFTYRRERNLTEHLFLLTAPTPNWKYTYPVANQCRLYFLEERRYQLNGDLFELVVNGDTARPQTIANEIVNFQATANMKVGAPKTTFGAGDSWSDLRGIQVSLESEVPLRDTVLHRSWQSEILPRNVISK